MKTEHLWHEISVKAKLLSPSPQQLAAINGLRDIAIRTSPTAVDGIMAIHRDQDGDLIITLNEAINGEPIANGAWGKLVISEDGEVALTGHDLDEPMIGYFG